MNRLLFPLLVAVTLAGPYPEALAQDKLMARGKEVQVTQEQLDDAFVVFRATLAAQGRQVPEAQRAQIERQLVEKLALTRILVGKATDADRAAAREKSDKLLSAEKEKAKSQARYEAQVRALGLAPEVFEKQLLERAICEEVLDRELRPKLGITPDKVRAFYDQNTARFKQPDRVRLRQVVMSLRNTAGGDLSDAEKAERRSLAERIVERTRKGETLEQLARQYSDDPPGRERGGEYIFPVGRMIPEFETAVLALPTNSVSSVITTPNALHVVEVIERIPSELVPFDKVETQIREGLELEETAKQLPIFQKQLFQEAGIEFFTTAKSP
ncbi:MAG: peptidylprolyl isomerase [Planctomycetota bacterium]|nr:peptidylprolyl isomerase [Planctomycetota bacterium]